MRLLSKRSIAFSASPDAASALPAALWLLSLPHVAKLSSNHLLLFDKTRCIMPPGVSASSIISKRRMRRLRRFHGQLPRPDRNVSYGRQFRAGVAPNAPRYYPIVSRINLLLFSDPVIHRPTLPRGFGVPTERSLARLASSLYVLKATLSDPILETSP